MYSHMDKCTAHKPQNPVLIAKASTFYRLRDQLSPSLFLFQVPPNKVTIHSVRALQDYETARDGGRKREGEGDRERERVHGMQVE